MRGSSRDGLDEPLTISFGGEDRPAVSVEGVTRSYDAWRPTLAHRLLRVFGGAALYSGAEVFEDDEDDDFDFDDDADNDEEVERRLKGRTVLDRVSLHVSGLGGIGIVGPSGSGKSVLLRCMAGWTAPSEGQVVVYGTLAPFFAQLMRLLPKRGSVKQVLPATLAAVRLPAGRTRSVLPEVAAWLGDPGLGKQQITAVIGQRRLQMLLGAMLLVQPDILLIDAPIPVGSFGEQAIDRIRELKRTSTLVIVAGPTAASVEWIADRVVYMANGRVVGDAPIDEALEREREEARLAAEQARLAAEAAQQAAPLS